LNTQRNVTIEVTVITETPFSIGAGTLPGSLADKGLVRDRRGWPLLPASSLKGVLRHQAERLARRLTPDVTLCHAPSPDRMCQSTRYDDLCPLCRIFGSPWYPASLQFDDLELTGPADVIEMLEITVPPAFATGRRYGVAVSRRRRVAEDQLLYSREVFLPGAPLEFGGAGAITGRVEQSGLALLWAAARTLRNLGGARSGGLGWGRVIFVVHDHDAKRDLAWQEVSAWLS
jgi:CRISPR/Cas system CSM-associated protein Csm3 (group 7 of RAMP superfamily)